MESTLFPYTTLFRSEFGAKLREIIDFAVIDDPRAAVFVEHRLVAAGKVDDREAPHAQAGSILDEDAFIVRAAVDDPVAHLPHHRFGDVALPGCAYDSGDSTHTDASILSTILSSILSQRPEQNPSRLV